jgi:hypothetical protein
LVFSELRELTPISTHTIGIRRSNPNKSGKPAKANLYDIQRTLCYADNRAGFRVYPKPIQDVFRQKNSFTRSPECDSLNQLKKEISLIPDFYSGTGVMLHQAPVSLTLVNGSSKKRKLNPGSELVGIELNPGPNVKQTFANLRKALQTTKKMKKKATPQKRVVKSAVQRSIAPLAKTASVRMVQPFLSGSAYTGDGRVTVRHREYLMDINGSVNYNVTTVPINPGLATTFGWLNVIAGQFESYKFRNLCFEYETQKSASTNGTLMMTIDFDAADAAPASKLQLMNTHNAVRSSVWNECQYRADGPDLLKFGVQRYIRNSALAANLDIKTYDVGTLFIATQGCADTTAVGELYVTYDVELITPQVGQAQNTFGDSAYITGGAAAPSTYLTGASVVGTSITVSGKTYTFGAPGQYLLSGWINQTAAGGLGVDGASTATVTPLYNNYTINSAYNLFDFGITVTAAGQTCVLNLASSNDTISYAVRVSGYQVSNG